MRSFTIRVGGLAAPAVALGLALGGCFTGPAPDLADPAAADQPVMTLSPAALSFTSAGGMTPPAQTVTVSDAGVGTLAPPVVTATYVGQEKDWLALSVSGGAAPYTITVQAIVAGLPPRPSPNMASISVDCPGASNTPLAVPVQLTVR